MLADAVYGLSDMATALKKVLLVIEKGTGFSTFRHKMANVKSKPLKNT